MSVAIITGASSGLGVCYVDAVTKIYPEIEEIWLIARREDRMREIAAAYPNKKFVIYPMDMADMENYRGLAAALEEHKPDVQLLINDAGISGGEYFESMPLERILQIIELNCKGAVAVTKTVLPYIRNGGNIIEVSSTSAFVPQTGLIIYCASKSFVSAFSLGLHQELQNSGRNINVCAVCPGSMPTEMNPDAGKKGTATGLLPVIRTEDAAMRSLRAAKNGRRVYTTGWFYKGYRVLAKVVPHSLIAKFNGI